MPVSNQPVVQLRVALTSTDYQQSIKFYCEGLGIQPAAIWNNDGGRAMMLELGNATLEIFDEAQADAIDRIEAGKRISGQVRFALQVPDLQAAMDRLLGHGAILVHPPVTTPWGDLNARLQDPDGMQITLFQAPEESRQIKTNSLYPSLSTLIETERLVLRPYQPGDGVLYHQISRRNRSHLAQYESGNALMGINSDSEAELVIQGYAASWEAGDSFFLGVFQKVTGEWVAQIYIGLANRELPEFELGYIADVEQEGKGYVTEAARAALHFVFEQLGAYRVRLECDDTNLRSLRVAERCGFVKEGHLRQNKKKADGSISGTLHYGLLRSEFSLPD